MVLLLLKRARIVTLARQLPAIEATLKALTEPAVDQPEIEKPN